MENPMISRHLTALKNALDPLAYRRYVTLSRRQFRFWIGAQRIRTTAWETLIENLPEDVDPKELSILEDEDDILIFFRDKMSDLA
jgi:hypothetical protein